MKELTRRLMQEAGLTEEQALQAITIIGDFAKERFPIFAGPIDKLFDKYAPKPEDDFLE